MKILNYLKKSVLYILFISGYACGHNFTFFNETYDDIQIDFNINGTKIMNIPKGEGRSMCAGCGACINAGTINVRNPHDLRAHNEGLYINANYCSDTVFCIYQNIGGTLGFSLGWCPNDGKHDSAPETDVYKSWKDGKIPNVNTDDKAYKCSEVGCGFGASVSFVADILSSAGTIL